MDDRTENDPTPEHIAAEAEQIRERGHLGKDGLWRPAWGPRRYPGTVPAHVVQVNAGDFAAAVREVLSH